MARRKARPARTKNAEHAAQKARSAQKKTAGSKKTTTRSSTTSKAGSTKRTPIKRASTRTSSANTRRKTTKAPSKAVLPERKTGERYYVLSVPYDLRQVASALKAKYYKGYGYVYVGKTLPPMLKMFESQDFTYDRWVEDDLNGSVRPPEKAKSIFVPRDHQKTAMKKIFASAKAGFRGFIEADDVGLGKTLSCAYGAYGVAKLKKAKNVLILCPKSVISHWANTLKSLPQDEGIRYCVLNYESAKKLLELPPGLDEAKRRKTKNSQIASKGVPKVKWDVVISDESHKLKNVYSSQRSKIFTKIARYEDKVDPPFVIYASATIGQNPAELAYMAPLIAQLTNNPTLTTIKDWEKLAEKIGIHGERNTDLNKYVWTEDEAEREADLKLIQSLLFSPKSPSIRRLPSQVAGWPEHNYVILPYNIEREQYELYNALWEEFVDEMDLDKTRKNPKGLAIQIRFRQKTSLLKIDNTVDLAVDSLENGRKVIISVDFEDTVNELRTRLEAQNYTVEEFNGRNVKEREEARIRFQKGKADVMLFSIREAVSLHAGEQLSDGTIGDKTPRETIIHDLPYTAIEVAQIAGRAHRDGQFSNIVIPCIWDTIDERMANTIVDRLRSMKRVMGDDISFTDKLKNIMLGRT